MNETMASHARPRGRPAWKEIPRRTKVIDSPALNAVGVQVGRTVAAHAAARLRGRRVRARSQWADEFTRLRRDGVVVLNDFLSADAFGRVTSAVAAADAMALPTETVHNGNVSVEVMWRHDLPVDLRRDVDLFFAHPTVLGVLGAAEQVEVAAGGGRCTIQRLRQGSEGTDLEAEVHSDIFFPTHKAWLYLTDVGADDGPLVYYPTSHRLAVRSLVEIYRNSVGPNEGSRRIEFDELARRRLAARVLEVPANTLVIANTHGFHGRVQGRPPGIRRTLTIELRPDPFRRPRRVGEDRSSATDES